MPCLPGPKPVPILHEPSLRGAPVGAPSRHMQLAAVTWSLLPGPEGGPDPLAAAGTGQLRWLWSCDRHGQHESWYVNIDMGFAGVQDISCLNHVRVVRTAA